MTRRHWQELPPAVREAVELRIGPVLHARPVATGAVSELVATLTTAGGSHFCKGITTAHPLAWMHRNEARINPHLPGTVPALRWMVEEDGWLLLGFEHVAGRHPDLAPGSPDLGPLAGALAALTIALTPSPLADVQPATKRWVGRLDPGVVDGDTLLHTDVTPRNFLIRKDDSMSVVDWSMPCRGAPWIDVALMVVRLIRADHTASGAEAWVGQIPAWAAAKPAALDAFAQAIMALTHERQLRSSAAHLQALAAAAECWARHRNGLPGSV